MTAIRSARAFLITAPREALADAAALALIGGLVFAGFVVPGLL